MPSLQYQLKSLVSSLSAEANRIKDPEIKKRFYLIKAVSESKKDVKKTCEMRGVSTDFFYTWATRLIEVGSLIALRSLSKTPKSFWNKTQARVEKRILKIRKAEPFKGPDRISFDLKRDYNMICPVSTVAAILKRKGLVTKEYREKLTKKHMRRYRRPWPGFLQMDFKYTPFLVESKQCYQLSVVDHHSSWRFIRTYDNRRVTTVIEFLNDLERECPFTIMQIQTDNASEFTDKFTSHYKGLMPTETHMVDIWCRKREIQHKLIPIGEKELNGKVENTHKWDDREFYSQVQVMTIEDLKAATKQYNQRWNDERPTKTLGWKTPNEVMQDAYVRAILYLKLMLPPKAFERPKYIQKKSIGSGTIYAQRSDMKAISESLKSPKRLKQPNAVDRYLQYLDWEAKQKIKYLLPVPVILQKFSGALRPNCFVLDVTEGGAVACHFRVDLGVTNTSQRDQGPR